MKVFSIVCLLAIAPLAVSAAQTKPKTPAATAKSSAKGGRTVELTGSDNMKYNLSTIEAKPGERLHVVLKSIGTAPKMAMAHNFVLLKEGADAQAFATAAMNARDTDFIPADQKDKIIAATALAGPGETVDVSFTAPSKAGTYTFLCSFPGHFAVGMKGQLVVK
jgi:azurin